MILAFSLHGIHTSAPLCCPVQSPGYISSRDQTSRLMWGWQPLGGRELRWDLGILLLVRSFFLSFSEHVPLSCEILKCVSGFPP